MNNLQDNFFCELKSGNHCQNLLKAFGTGNIKYKQHQHEEKRKKKKIMTT